MSKTKKILAIIFLIITSNYVVFPQDSGFYNFNLNSRNPKIPTTPMPEPLVEYFKNLKSYWLDIPYAKQSKDQIMDIFAPNEGTGPYPVIVSIHGGGWFSGDKRNSLLAFKMNALQAGYAVIAINFRSSREAKYPAQIFDCKAAIRFIKSNAVKLNINPDKIAVWGESTGAHLASLLGTTAQIAELEDLSMGNRVQSSRVKAVIDWYGPTDFSKLDMQASNIGILPEIPNTDPRSPVTYLLGGTYLDKWELSNKANPINYLTTDDSYFIIQHGKKDNIIPYLQSQDLAEKISAYMGANKVYIDLFDNAMHGDNYKGKLKYFETEENFNHIIKLLNVIMSEK